MDIKFIEKRLCYTLDKGLNSGLERKDYYYWHDMLSILYGENLYYNSEYQIIIDAIEQLLKLINDSGIMYKYSKENIEYIKQNSLLLPLVLTNNGDKKVKMFVDNSYLFTCPFHDDRKPSFSVTDKMNLAHCLGKKCGRTVNSSSYLKEYEKITYTESIELLAYIFLYDIKQNNSYLKNLANKYQETILSIHYKELLEEGYERLINRCGESKEINEIYEKRYDIIDRLRTNKYDPNFKYQENPKVLKLTLDCIK